MDWTKGFVGEAKSCGGNPTILDGVGTTVLLELTALSENDGRRALDDIVDCLLVCTVGAIKGGLSWMAVGL